MGPKEAKASDKVTWLIVFCFFIFKKSVILLKIIIITLCILCEFAALQIQLEGGAQFCSGTLMLPRSLLLHQMKMALLL